MTSSKPIGVGDHINSLMINKMIQFSSSKLELEKAKLCLESHTERAQRLANQAFSVQGASSELAGQLLSCINDLNDCSSASARVNAKLNSGVNFFNHVNSQLKSQRADGTINLSDYQKILSVGSFADKLTVLIKDLKKQNDATVDKVIRIINQSDQILNGPIRTSQSNSTLVAELKKAAQS